MRNAIFTIPCHPSKHVWSVCGKRCMQKVDYAFFISYLSDWIQAVLYHDVFPNCLLQAKVRASQCMSGTVMSDHCTVRAGGNGAAGTASAVPLFPILGACPQVPREEALNSPERCRGMQWCLTPSIHNHTWRLINEVFMQVK